jgi:signal transduction histidine kinase
VDGGDIVVSARAEGDTLRITVRDSGVGCDGAPRAGFGLAQVRERLATAFGAQGRMDWSSAPGQGTQVTLSLPLHAA